MVTLKQYNGSTVQPTDDAVLYDTLLGVSGVIQGAACTIVGANQIRVATGRIMICGRMVSVDDELVTANVSTSGSQQGRLILRVDMANTEKPAYFTTQTGTPLPSLVQEDINTNGLIYEFEMATYTAGELAISNLVSTAYSIPLQADKIVEEGTSGIWRYRKWESGLAECWGNSSQTIDIDNMWDAAGNLVYGTGEPVLYPFTFTEVPSCMITQQNYDGLVILAIRASGTTTQTPTPGLVKIAPTNDGYEMIFAFEAKGKYR